VVIRIATFALYAIKLAGYSQLGGVESPYGVSSKVFDHPLQKLLYVRIMLSLQVSFPLVDGIANCIGILSVGRRYEVPK